LDFYLIKTWRQTKMNKFQQKEQNPRKFPCVTIGNTPIIDVEGILAKLETTNPTGSLKDRMACYMADKAEERGELGPGSKIIEVTSGNTGIAFAMIAAARGYKFTAVMPKSMSIERRKMIELFGANIVFTCLPICRS
jgi:cysteine synthase